VAQAVVDAVAALLEAGAFDGGTGGAGDDASSRGECAEAAALAFLAAHLAANRASASGDMLLRVLRHLSAPSSDASSGMGAAEREAVFTDVVSAAGGGMSPADRQQVRPRSMSVAARRHSTAQALLSCFQTWVGG
jgi:hypothetical protein